MPDPYKSTIQVYNRLGKKYIKDTAAFIAKERAQFIKLFQKGAKILEVGCAGGRDSKVFVAHGLKTTGIDASAVFIKEAKKNVPGGKFIKMDVRKLKFPAESFNGIWANAVLLHLKKQDIPRVLAKLFAVLKPNGVLHVSVKYGTGSKMVKEQLSGGQERLFSFFRKRELEQFFKSSGFKVIYSEFSADTLGRKDVKWIAVWGKKV